MSSIVQLKRSAVSGKVPVTSSLNLGELALNTYDGKIFFRRSGSTDTIQEVIVTNSTNTGSVTITGTLTAASIVGSISASNGIVSGSSQVISILSSLNTFSSSINSFTASHNLWSSSVATTGSNTFTGAQTFNSDITVLGAVNARQFNIGIISSSVIYQSGSTKFGDTSDDIMQVTGSVQISGSQIITGSVNITGSIYLNGVALGGTSAAASGTFVFPENFDYAVYDTGSFLDFNSQSLAYNLNFNTAVAVGSPIQFLGALSHINDLTKIYPTATSIDTIVGDVYVGSVSSQSFYTNLPITASGLNVSGLTKIVGNTIHTGSLLVSGSTIFTQPSSSTTAAIVVSGSDVRGGQGYLNFLQATNTNIGVGARNKTFRLSDGGAVEIINSAYTGTLLSLGDSGDMTISGSIVMPTRPAFRVAGTGASIAATTIISGSAVSVEYNQGNAYNSTTGKFTAPIAGLYQVNVVCRAAGNSLPAAQIIVRKNSGGTINTQVMLEWAANTTANHIGGSTISKLAVGDTLYVEVTNGTISFDGNDNFSVAYIG